MNNSPTLHAMRWVLPLLAVLLPTGADSVSPSLSQVDITPASAGTPPSFTGVVTGGPPNGTAWLQATVDLGVADPWTNVHTATLDNLGSVTFTNISDTRPQAAAAERDFFRVATSTDSSPPFGTMVFIPAGTFQMGDAFSEGGQDERPVHNVYVSGFYLQNTEVSKAQWDVVANWAAANGYDINAADGLGKAANHPVHTVTWYEVVKYCNARSQMENLTPCYTVSGSTYKTGTDASVACDWNASGYRLPTEAEWEKAARGGLSGKRFPWGDTINHSNANYRAGGTLWSFDTSGYPSPTYHPAYYEPIFPPTSPVGSFPANGFGLYDMTGNLWEWCWDGFGSSYYSASPGSDPRGPSALPTRVLRGGSWENISLNIRIANRLGSYSFPTYSDSEFGFRPARGSGQ